MYDVFEIFSICIKDFDLYRPTRIDDNAAQELSMILDAFASTGTNRAARTFASELSFFIRESLADEKSIWVLGV